MGVLLMLALTAAPALAQFEDEYDPGTPQFQRTWDRTDKPVEDGVISRTWNWGPGRSEVMMEDYTESPDGMRQVQYFDKSRMEITDPSADDDGLWYVTNGLLVVEMVTGMMQVGDANFEAHGAADVNIVGDPGNAFSPTYADIADYDLRDEPADSEGAAITRTLNEDGEAEDDASYAEYGVTAAENVMVPGIDHTVAAPFWEFMNSSGPVWEDGQIVQDLLFPNPYYATGLPITEAYWATAPVGGTDTDVLWQCFERRCLTYTPANDAGFQVEAGNVGQHYWTWRYADQPQPENYDGTYYADLNQFNDSGVSGSVMLTLDGTQLSVEIDASGLTPDVEHLQHIHGFEDGSESTCVDSDAYGPVIVALEPFPMADADGNLSYSQTLTVDPEMLGDPAMRAVVIHGMMVDDEYNVGIPVACGDLEEGDAPEPGEYDGMYYTEIGGLNESGVTGTATFELDGDQLHVSVNADGLAALEQHAQHIHGFNAEDMAALLQSQVAVCPTPDMDMNEDGFVDLPEGAPAYGPVLYGLEPFPSADNAGEIAYQETLTVDPEVLGDLSQRVIVLHGGEGADGLDPLLPVGCGEIMEGELPEQPDAEEYHLYFGELNNSGVMATGTLTLNEDQLTVEINGTGFEADMVHPQHIHGDDGELAVCPGPDYDEDGDDWVDLEEGADAYGGVQLPLTIGGEADAYPTASGDGSFSFSETYTVDPIAYEDVEERVIVLHGLSDGEEYIATLPIACSMIVPADSEAYVADDLDGANELPEASLSDGYGNAMFWYDDFDDILYYMLNVKDVDDVTAAHIHAGREDENGGVVAFLFSLDDGADPVEAYGILSTGRITADDLVGVLDGMTLMDLVDLMEGSDDITSDSYVNVHSDEYPGGVVRDQITAVDPGA